MKLSILGSSSSANCYVLHNDKEALIIEAGVTIQNVKKALDFNVSKVVGCFVTHEHGDHSKYVEQYLKASIDVMSSKGTIDNIVIKGNRKPLAIEKYKIIQYGGFRVFAFDTQHDCQEPIGFLINHEEIGTLLFATDTYYLKHTFSKLNNIMIECNYSNAILDENVKNGTVNYVRKKRVKQSHMSLETLKDILQVNDLKHVNNIILLHLSKENGDGNLFKDEIEKLTGCKVLIAKKGIEMIIDKTPF